MTDITPTPEDSISDATLLSESEYKPVPTGMLEATYTCPECGAVVVKIVGNTMQFLQTHIREQSDKPNEQGFISLVFCHTILDRGMFVPPRAYVPPQETHTPFLNVQSSQMKPHPHK